MGDRTYKTWGNLVGTFVSSYSSWRFFPQLIHSFTVIIFLAFVFVVKTRLATSIPGTLESESLGLSLRVWLT